LQAIHGSVWQWNLGASLAVSQRAVQLSAQPLGGATEARACYSPPMAQASPKERILDALRDLPSDASIDDAIERLVFLARIDEGLAELDVGQGVSHEDVRRRFRA